MTTRPCLQAKVTPIPDNLSRPLWSVMIPTYNCAEYLRKTLESVLVQAPDSDIMQIAVVDNCSTQDDPEAVVKELGAGRVEFYRNPENIGSTRNFNRCIELARGRLVHLLHGDDYVLEGFYEGMQSLFEIHAEIGAAFCRSMIVDESENLKFTYPLELPESGILPDTWLDKIATIFCVPAPGMVIRRETYENLGGYDLNLPGADDWEMWVRVASQYSIGYEVNCLAAYRVHSESFSESLFDNKIALLEIYKGLQAMKAHLPPHKKNKLFRLAKKNTTLYHLRTYARAFIHRKQWSQAFSIIQLSLLMSPSYRVILTVSQIVLIDCSRSIVDWAMSVIKRDGSANVRASKLSRPVE